MGELIELRCAAKHETRSASARSVRSVVAQQRDSKSWTDSGLLWGMSAGTRL